MEVSKTLLGTKLQDKKRQDSSLFADRDSAHQAACLPVSQHAERRRSAVRSGDAVR
jgi:hypothetical protein